MNNNEFTIINWDEFSESDLDKPVFRIFSLEKFLTSLNSNSLFFVKPHLFEDPYEGFLLKKIIKNSERKLSDFLPCSYFVQCWTLHKESSLMWTAYAPNKDGIMLETTLRQLVELRNLLNDHVSDVFLGRITYLKQEEIFSMFSRSQVESKRDLSALVVNSLFVKREAFKEENEFRIVLQNNTTNLDNIQFSKVGFNLTQQNLFKMIVNKVILDPRMTITQVREITKLIERFELEVHIVQSDLYQILNW